MASLDLHEKANFTRLSRLLVDKGTEALRNTFDGIHSHANLPAVLSANKTSLLKLKPRVINDSQWDLLYPPCGNPPDSKTFDVTLLTILFRNICGLPTTGWGVMPANSDRSMQANIVRIRLFRNDVYAHVTSTQVDNMTFESLWNKISQALVDLNIPQKDIDELKKCSIGPREEECVAILKDWKSHEEECLFMLEGLNSKVKSMESSINCLTQITKEKRDGEISRSKETNQEHLRNLAKHNFRSKITSKVKSFLPGTREWLLNKVDEWFNEDEQESRTLLLTAGPGFGKSVFSAKVCEYFKKKGKLGACHFCDFGNANLRNPMMMLQSLASQMCENVVGFKEKLIDQLKRPHEVQNLKEAFGIYLQNPLDELELTEPILIVIDGLDESAADDKNEIVNLIADYFPDLPVFIKVLVTSRPQISVEKLSESSKSHINIGNSYADNNSDLKIYLQSCLPRIPDRSEDSGVFEKLVEMCEGSFLYAFFIQSELQKRNDLDQLMLDEITDFLPKGLDSIYQAYFRRFEEELKGIMHGNFDVLRVLKMLVAAKESLPLTFIARALGLASDCRETKNIIDRVNEAVSCLFYVSDDLVTVFHKSVIDWLLANGYKHHEYTVKSVDGHASLWIMCEQMFEGIKKSVCSGHDPDQTNDFKYALNYGLRHLESCKIEKSYNWLVDIVMVYVFLKTRPRYILGFWEYFLRVNADVTDELRARISWHIVEVDIILKKYFVESNDKLYMYLTSVLAHSPKAYFSEDERGIAQSLLSNLPRLVDINYDHQVDFKPLAVFADDQFTAVGVSIDKSIAAVGLADGTVILVGLPSLVEIWQYRIGYISCCTFSPDDSLLLFGKLESALRISDKKEVPFFRNSKEYFDCCGFSPNGQRLVTTQGSSTIKLWDIAKQSLLSLLNANFQSVFSCCFSSTGLFIIANEKSEMYDNGKDLFCVWNAITWQRCDQRNNTAKASMTKLCMRCFPRKFELPAFKRLNVKQCQPPPPWKGSCETWSTGIFNEVECYFALDDQSLSVVENTHFMTLASWNFPVRRSHKTSRKRVTKMTIINDHDLWLYADNQKLVAFRTTPAQRSSCMPCPALVYSSTFSSDGLNLATCTSDGFVNVWNIDKNHVDQRFKFSEKETAAACWWSEKFLYVFHVLDGVPTLSKYPMNANSKLLPSQRDVRHFPAEVLHSTTVVDFLEGFLVFKCKKTNSILVLDVKGVADMQMVNLPRVHPNMMITVSPRCSFVFGSGKKMFYIWKRNEAEAPVYEVFFRGYSRDNVGGCCFNSLSNVAVVAHIPFLPHIPLLYFQIIDLDTGKYKTARFQCPLTHPSCKIFCFNKVVICATRNEIYILDMDTGALIEYSFQRYLTKKFLNQLKLSPDETTLAVPMMNGDMEFIRLSIAQNPSLPTLKAEAAIEWDNMC